MTPLARACSALACLLFATGCAISQVEQSEEAELATTSQEIVGGFEIPTAVPYLVALYWSSPDASGQICGGTLIGHKWVMTAAHCVHEEDGSVTAHSALSIVFRDANLAEVKPGHRVPVKRVVPHPEYDAVNVINDIALLELEKPLKLTAPIAYDRNDALKPGALTLVVGWGVTTGGELEPAPPEEQPEPTVESAGGLGKNFVTEPTWTPSDLGGSDQVRGLFLTVLSNKGCDRRMNSGLVANGYDVWPDLITPDVVCAAPRNPKAVRGVCFGDSGGPLVAFDWKRRRYVVAGIVSWSFACADPEFPGAYHRVASSKDFIRDVTGL